MISKFRYGFQTDYYCGLEYLFEFGQKYACDVHKALKSFQPHRSFYSPEEKKINGCDLRG